MMLQGVRSNLREQLAFWNDRQVLIVLMPFNPFYYQLAHQEKNADLRVLREVYHNNLKEMTEWDGLIRRLNDVLRAVAAEFPNTRYLETRAIFDEEDRNVIYGDYAHFYPKGHVRMAEVLYDYLKEQHVIDQRR
jgi:lysophospholipase L1-like esterase